MAEVSKKLTFALPPMFGKLGKLRVAGAVLVAALNKEPRLKGVFRHKCSPDPLVKIRLLRKDGFIPVLDTGAQMPLWDTRFIKNIYVQIRVGDRAELLTWSSIVGLSRKTRNRAHWTRVLLDAGGFRKNVADVAKRLRLQETSVRSQDQVSRSTCPPREVPPLRADSGFPGPMQALISDFRRMLFRFERALEREDVRGKEQPIQPENPGGAGTQGPSQCVSTSVQTESTPEQREVGVQTESQEAKLAQDSVYNLKDGKKGRAVAMLDDIIGSCFENTVLETAEGLDCLRKSARCTSWQVRKVRSRDGYLGLLLSGWNSFDRSIPLEFAHAKVLDF